jgi:hypothetical protein
MLVINNGEAKANFSKLVERVASATPIVTSIV